MRKLVAHAQAHGAGHNYLIQHSAGSGKSNSIAWLAHRLATLHDADDEKVFHAVVVITDRRVLDRQLQDAIHQIEHKRGVVQKIDENTQQLARALAAGTPIIIATIQKFPFIAQAIGTLGKQGEEVAIATADDGIGQQPVRALYMPERARRQVAARMGVLQVGGARNVPGTLHKVPGRAVICCSVPGTFSAPSV